MTCRNYLVVTICTIVCLLLTAGIVTAERPTGPFSEFKLTPDDADAEPEYGRSVAIEGDLVAVGDGGDGAIGAVYLYRRVGMVYVPEEKLEFPEAIPTACLEAADPEEAFGNCPEFGRTVAIQGNTVLVGARFAPVGDLKAGAVYTFQQQGDSWNCREKITSPTPEKEDNFGRALAIQGSLLVVTARKENLNANDVGAAYVYRYDGGVWMFQEKLTARDATPGAYFGQSVSVQGEYMVIGARNADPNGAGAFYLFQQSGEEWTEVAKVTPTKGKNNDQYGFALAVSGDTVAVTARRVDQSNEAKDTGAVYVYSITPGGVVLQAILTASDAMPGDEFGQSVAMAGNVIAVGAWKDDANLGSIYLFRQKEGQWVETAKIQATDGKAGDQFGYSLAAFGNRMVTGAHRAESEAGAAYILPLKFGDM